MTFTQLATELCNLCGEGYQDYINRAKEHLYRAFDNLILTGQAREDEYYGLINSATASFNLDEKIASFPELNTDNMVKIISVTVDGTPIDQLTNDEAVRAEQMPDFVANLCFYVQHGQMIFLNVPQTPPLPTNTKVTYVNKFKEEDPGYDVNKLITNSFAEKALLIAKPTLLEEINI